MELLKDLVGSLFWATVISVAIYAGGIVATSFLARKSRLLKPIGSGLKLLVLFVAVQAFLLLGAGESHPRIARYLQFCSWIIAVFALLRLTLYMYGDLFIVRWRKGSFPAAFKHIITAVVTSAVTIFLLKELLEVNVTSLIATTTVLTATIGLALQGTLANMLAGLTIHLEKPLKQGDWVQAGGHEGRVMDITLRSTRLLTIENNEINIPNSKVLSESVTNYSMPDPLSVRTLSIGVSYHIPPNTVRTSIREVLDAVPGVQKQPAPLVRVANYGDYAVQYEIRYAISEFQRYLETEAEIMNLLWYRFKRDNIEIPFPVQTVHLRQVTPESQQAAREHALAEVMALTEQVDIFLPFSPGERRRLAATAAVKTFAAGECPVIQGEAGDSFYIIRRGTVAVIVEKEPGRSVVIAELGPGNFFGEMSLLTGAVRTATIRVKEDAEFVVIDRENFRSIIVNNPSIAESLSRILAERQAGLAAQREKLDTSAAERRRQDESGKLLRNIRQFFGLFE
jgi:small-conductance mechanosensitive channel/CRP-like cAMP-binding protein